MFFELNGMAFFLSFTPGIQPDAVKVSIVDEAFLMEPARVTARSATCVYRLIRSYTGMHPDAELCQTIASRVTIPALAA